MDTLAQPNITSSQLEWDKYWIKFADLASTKSKDPSTKVGAVIVGPDQEFRSSGFNGFPRLVNDTDKSRLQRPEKYFFTEHAERNSIFNACLSGTRTKGCTLYLNFYPIPCHECVRGIIQVGITTVVGPDIPFPGKGQQWKESLRISKIMMEEANIKTRIIKL